MILVFHGEDQPALREKFLQFKHSYSAVRFWDQEIGNLSKFLMAPSLLTQGRERDLMVLEDPKLKEITGEMCRKWEGGAQDVAILFSRPLKPAELGTFGKSQILSFSLKVPRNVFPFLDALLARKKAEALLQAHRLLREGQDLDFILKMIVWQLRMLARVKSGAVHGLKPYTVGKLQRYSGAWDWEKIRRSLSAVLEEDLRHKQGKKRPLDLLINRIIR